MILTGRAVKAEEALSIGLMNRVVGDGSALSEAIQYAEEISKFPQICMRTDRMSALTQWDLTLQDALRVEGDRGNVPLSQEAVQAANVFVTKQHKTKI